MPAISRINRSLALGFEEFEQALNTAAQLQNEGYPPYNIERHVEHSTGAERIKIMLAVAGFSKDLLEVKEEGQKLIITGQKRDNENEDFLHQGIAMRQFQRIFILANSLEIRSAVLKEGLLTVELFRPESGSKSRTIEILTA